MKADAQNRLLAVTKKLYAQYDQISKPRIEATAAQEGKSIPCKKGCAHCCYLVITVSIPELIVAALDAEANGMLEGGYSLGSRLAEMHSNFEAIQQPDMDVDKWAHQHRRCAFLKDDDTCACYNLRPFACRTYSVLSEPEACADPDAQRLVVQDTQGLKMWWGFMAGLAEEMGLPSPGFAPMPYGIVVALTGVTQGIYAMKGVMKTHGLDDQQAALVRWMELEMTTDEKRAEGKQLLKVLNGGAQ